MELNQDYITKFQSFTREVVRRFPPVTFVGLVQRIESESWDVVVGGDSLRTHANFLMLANILKTHFTGGELMSFSMLSLVDSTSTFVTQMRQAIVIEDGYATIENTRVFQIYIKKAYIFICKPLRTNSR